MKDRRAIPDGVRERFTYDPETGFLMSRKVRTIGSRVLPFERACRVAKSSVKSQSDYCVVSFGGSAYAAHRVIWFIVTGEQPPDQIDHKDLNGTNNRWPNMRAATPVQNGANKAPIRKGLKGAVRLRSGRYQAQVKCNGVFHYLGSFATEAEANAAYAAKAVELFGEFARAA